MSEWFQAHPWIAYILIFLFMTYVYIRVFRVRKLPIIKEIIVYVLIGLGALMLLVFQIDVLQTGRGLPIIQSLGVAVILMLMVQIRYFVEKLQKRKRNG